MSKRIDLGCGLNKAKDYIGVDICPASDADIIHDCEKKLPFEDNSIDEIRAYDFLEHIHQDKIISVFNEIWRVLKPDGILKFKVPDAMKGQGAFQDLTHRTYFTQNTFKYFESKEFEILYGIKAHFKIGELKSIKYEVDYWGENYCLLGYLIAIKGKVKDKNIIKPIVPIRNNPIFSNMIMTTDDLSVENLKYFRYWDKAKQRKPELKLICFTIAEGIDKNDEFKEFYEARKDWITIGVHCFNHDRVQEAWRQDQEIWIKKALDILKPYLPEKYLYRPPGFRTLPKTESILRKLGFAGCAYQEFIKMFNGEIKQPLFNTHCCDDENCINPITKIYKDI